MNSSEIEDLIPFIPITEKEMVVPGTQIVYVPSHIITKEGEFDRFHPEADWGFVTSVGRDANNIFCRFWQKRRPGHRLKNKLNSQAASRGDLMKATSARRENVRHMLALLYDL